MKEEPVDVGSQISLHPVRSPPQCKHARVVGIMVARTAARHAFAAAANGRRGARFRSMSLRAAAEAERLRAQAGGFRITVLLLHIGRGVDTADTTAAEILAH